MGIGICRQGLNRFTFNGQSEKQANLADGKGYFYETDFRSYDATLGRFHAYDLMASAYDAITPYHFALNNPISANDPTGLEAKDWIANKKTGEITWDEKVKSKEDLAKSDKKITHTYEGQTTTATDQQGNTKYGDQYGNWHNEAPLPEVTLSAKKPSVYDPAYHASTSPTSTEACTGYGIAGIITLPVVASVAAATGIASAIETIAPIVGRWLLKQAGTRWGQELLQQTGSNLLAGKSLSNIDAFDVVVKGSGISLKYDIIFGTLFDLKLNGKFFIAGLNKPREYVLIDAFFKSINPSLVRTLQGRLLYPQASTKDYIISNFKGGYMKYLSIESKENVEK